jgi:hypothetical protein
MVGKLVLLIHTTLLTMMIWISLQHITKEEEKNSNNHRIYAFYGSSNQLCGEASW